MSAPSTPGHGKARALPAEPTKIETIPNRGPFKHGNYTLPAGNEAQMLENIAKIQSAGLLLEGCEMLISN